MVKSKHDDLIIRIANIARGDRGHATNKKVSWKRLRELLGDPEIDKKHTLEQYKALHVDQQNKLKDVGSFVGGPFRDGIRQKKNLIQRSIITLDVDAATPKQIKFLKSGKSDACRFEFYGSTTRKHTEENPRWRFVFPITRPLTIEEYPAVSRILASELFKTVKESMFATDVVSFRPAQVMYWPSICKDSVFDTIFNKGKVLNPDKFLAAWDGDWTDWRELPFSDKYGNARPSSNEDAEDPRTKKGFIGAFCRAYYVEDAISEFLTDIYAAGDQDSEKPRYSYLQGSGTNGAVVQDDGLFLFSHHGTDPCGDRLVNAFDLVRIHWFGELDVGLPEDTRPTDLPSYKEMVKHFSDDEAVQQELEEADDDYSYPSNNPVTFQDLGPAPQSKKNSNNDHEESDDEDSEEDESEDEEDGEDDDLDDQPNLRVLNQSNLAAPKFPIEVLGEFWADRVKDWSDGASAPIDFPAMGVLTAASALIGNSRWVRVDRSWKEPPVIWTSLVGPPSSNKSPSLNELNPIFDKFERMWDADNAEKRRIYEKEKFDAEERLQAWKKDAREALNAGDESEAIPADCDPPPPPAERRITVDDTTIEGLIEISSLNPRGLLLFKDELSSLFDNMGRYANSGSDRPMYLQAFGGRRYTVDRKSQKGKKLVVPRFFLSILGGIQPDVLNDLLKSKEDGFQARFMYVWPEINPKGRGMLSDDDVNIDAPAFRALSKLTDLEPEDEDTHAPKNIPLSHKAHVTFLKWYNVMHPRDEGKNTPLGNAMGKTFGLVARLSLILEHLWWAAEFRRSPEPEKVSRKAVKAAIKMVEEYVKPMQRRAYAHANRSSHDINARLVADWIMTVKPKSFTANDIYRDKDNSKLKRDGKAISEGIVWLIEENWLTEVENKTKGVGRPTKRFEVNPLLWKAIKDFKQF